MRRALLILSLFGLLFITSCGGKVAIEVTKSDGTRVGEIDFGDEEQSSIVDAHGTLRGKVDGMAVTDANGKPVGAIQEKNGKVVILDTNNNPVGSLNNDTDCYGKGTEKLGMISASIDREAAAAACLLLLLPQ